HEEALKSFQACQEIKKEDAGLWYELALTYISLNQKEEAMTGFHKAVELDPENWWYNANIITLLVQEKKTEEAIEYAESLLKAYPEKEQAYDMLIHLYKETKQYTK